MRTGSKTIKYRNNNASVYITSMAFKKQLPTLVYEANALLFCNKEKTTPTILTEDKDYIQRKLKNSVIKQIVNKYGFKPNFIFIYEHPTEGRVKVVAMKPNITITVARNNDPKHYIDFNEMSNIIKMMIDEIVDMWTILLEERDYHIIQREKKPLK